MRAGVGVGREASLVIGWHAFGALVPLPSPASRAAGRARAPAQIAIVAARDPRCAMCSAQHSIFELDRL